MKYQTHDKWLRIANVYFMVQKDFAFLVWRRISRLCWILLFGQTVFSSKNEWKTPFFRPSLIIYRAEVEHKGFIVTSNARLVQRHNDAAFTTAHQSQNVPFLKIHFVWTEKAKLTKNEKRCGIILQLVLLKKEPGSKIWFATQSRNI